MTRLLIAVLLLSPMASRCRSVSFGAVSGRRIEAGSGDEDGRSIRAHNPHDYHGRQATGWKRELAREIGVALGNRQGERLARYRHCTAAAAAHQAGRDLGDGVRAVHQDESCELDGEGTVVAENDPSLGYLPWSSGRRHTANGLTRSRADDGGLKYLRVGTRSS